MIKNKKVVALVPLRGGSKSIKNKNLKKIGGKPLAFWVLKSATESPSIDEVWVSTDSKKIKKTVENFDLPIKVIDRPDAFATDTASTESVMFHFAEHVPFDILVTIQATSPLTESADFTKALEYFAQNNLDSLVTGVNLKRFFWTHDGTPLNYDPAARPRRQDFAGTIMENGAFYITTRDTLHTHKHRLGGKRGTYAMHPDTAREIDEPEDFKIVAKILKKRKNKA